MKEGLQQCDQASLLALQRDCQSDWTEWDRRSTPDKACRSESDGWLCLPNTDLSAWYSKTPAIWRVDLTKREDAGAHQYQLSLFKTVSGDRFFQAAWLWRHQKDNFYNTISQMRWTGYSNVKQCKIMLLKTVLKTRRRTMHKPRYDIVNNNAKYHVNQCESNANSHWKHQPCSSLRSLPINNVTKRPRPLRRSLVGTCGSPQTEMPWVAILNFYLHAFSKPAP